MHVDYASNYSDCLTFSQHIKLIYTKEYCFPRGYSLVGVTIKWFYAGYRWFVYNSTIHNPQLHVYHVKVSKIQFLTLGIICLSYLADFKLKYKYIVFTCSITTYSNMFNTFISAWPIELFFSPQKFEEVVHFTFSSFLLWRCVWGGGVLTFDLIFYCQIFNRNYTAKNKKNLTLQL